MTTNSQPPVMSDNRPYLVRALYDWIIDNGCTPFLTVQANVAGVQVPGEFVQDDRITLSIAPRAVESLNLGNDAILFSATFGGQFQDIRIPTRAVLAIFARENGQGMMFEVTPEPDPEPPRPDDSGSKGDGESSSGGDGAGDSGASKRPKLKVVK